MQIACLETADGPRYAIRAGEGWAVVEDCFADPLILTGVTVSDADARLLAPCEPRVLVGIAHNKTNNDHPLPIQAWHKSVRSVVGPDEGIQARRDVGTVNIEGELAVVIGRDTEGITVETAFRLRAGYRAVNDVTNVDRNALDEKIFEGKGGHGYTPMGPWIETELDARAGGYHGHHQRSR
jgi:Fumarylacetoacetate (FAA) hydrolase family/Rv2993c-like, N-terminal